MTGTVRRMWAGLRPITPDGRPIVGREPAVAGLWYATGHGRSGVLLAAMTAAVLADLVTTGVASLDVSAWRPERLNDRMTRGGDIQPSG
jgi:glycine/D-amino acid oxidase-like deaminating enzyme